MSKIGLQLYSIKEIAEKDFFGAIKLTAKSGYGGVEFAGFFNTSAKELKKVLEDEGLEPCGSHTAVELLLNDINAVVEYNLELGNKYIIVPWLPENMRSNKNEWLKTAEIMNEFNEKLKSEGLKLGYHNHDFEFIKFDGKYGFDIFAKNTVNDILLEIDTYWVAHPGIDVVGFLKKYKNRLELLHIKDIDDKKESTEIGNGNIDFREVIATADETEWFIVEQEHFNIPQDLSIKTSCDYLRGILK